MKNYAIDTNSFMPLGQSLVKSLYKINQRLPSIYNIMVSLKMTPFSVLGIITQ